MKNARTIAATMAAVVGAVGAGCGDDEPQAAIRLSEGDGCGDAFFWATTNTGDVAVTVSIDARDRSADQPTTLPIDVSDPAVTVEVLRGRDLARNLCTDAIDAASEPTSRQSASAGSGSVTLDPAPSDPTVDGCGTVTGRLRLDGLVAEDGTEFEPIRVTSDSIGCYSG